MAGNVSVLESAARTATLNSDDRSTGGIGAHIIVNVTAVAATPSIVVRVQGKCGITGVYYDLLVSPAITGTGTTVLKIGPGLTPVAGAAAADFLPATWRARVEHGDADSITYSVTANIGGDA